MVSAPRRRYGWLQDRAQVERLEDRVLLAAEPMLQVSRSDPLEPMSSANVLVEAIARDSAVRTVADVLAASTRIDLSRAASQNPQLTGSGRLLELNASLQNLVIDLGAGDDPVTLLQESDGRLRLVSDSGAEGGLYEFLFARPTSTLAIRGLGGADRVLIDSVDLGQASLFVEAEGIYQDDGKRLSTGGSVILRAEARLSGTDSEDVAKVAEIGIDGFVDIGGELVLDAWVSTQIERSGEVLLALTDLSVQTRAQSWIGPTAQIEASSVEVVARTENLLDVQRSAAGGVVQLTVDQVTRAGVAGGAVLTLVPATGTGDDVASQPGGLLIEAIDRSRFHAVLDTQDSLASGIAEGLGFSGFDAGLGLIDLFRDTQAMLGDGLLAATVQGVGGGNAGRVHVAAASLDAPQDAADDQERPGVFGEVISSLIGVQTLSVTDNVEALVTGVGVDAESLAVYALSGATHGSSGKVAANKGRGVTRAVLADAGVAAPGPVTVLARDATVFNASSAGFSADVPMLDSIKVGIASASNTVERAIEASALRSVIEAGDLALIASGAA